MLLCLTYNVLSRQTDILIQFLQNTTLQYVHKEVLGDSGPVKRKYIVDMVGRLPVILLVMDAGNNNSVVNTYVYANSQVLAQYEGAQEGANDKHFYLHDRLGSVRLLIDESGDVANVYTYKPYGELIATESAESAANPFKYTGQWYDSEIDQYYLCARMYDPQLMRFTARDPVEGKFEEPLTLHVYLYCANDSLNRIDPFGLIYADVNVTGSFGIIHGAKLGGSIGWGSTGNPWALLGGMVVGGALCGFGPTGGVMIDYDTNKLHIYGGLAWSTSLLGGTSSTLSFSKCGKVEAGWQIAGSVTVGLGYYQKGQTLFREENFAFEEYGGRLWGDPLGFTGSFFYVFPGIDLPGTNELESIKNSGSFNPQEYFGQLDPIDQAIMMGNMIQDTGEAILEGGAGIALWGLAVNVASQYGM